MSPTSRRRIAVIGASGVFGERLARRLATWPDIELILAARRIEPLHALLRELEGAGATACLRTVVFDRAHPEAFHNLGAFAVVDCAGPFQDSGYTLALAAMAAGAHYIDLADARAFVAGFPNALSESAARYGRWAITGASSSPALSHAAADKLTARWERIDRLKAAISPGSRAPSGRSVVRAILSWAGQPVRCFVRGGWRIESGWGLLQRAHFPRLGVRWLSLAETADLDLLPAQFQPAREAVFLAGVENPILHIGLWLLAWPVRLKLIRSLAPLTGPLRRTAMLLRRIGSDRGGMIVEADGIGADGYARRSLWALWAESGVGPYVPVLPALAILRRLVHGDLKGQGARACVGLVSVEDILREAAGLPIRTAAAEAWPDSPSLFRRLLGSGFDCLPAAVRRVHAGIEPVRLAGSARVKGGRGLAGVCRKLMGMPPSGLYDSVEVEIRPTPRGELWRRRFGRHAFQSTLSNAKEIAQFQERFGLLTFRFELEPYGRVLRWRHTHWRLGPVPLPLALAPRIAARIFEREGRYRFSIAVAHRWIGLLVAYAGQLELNEAPR